MSKTKIKMMKQKYRRAYVRVPDTRQLVCEACGQSSRTHNHHWIYAYTTKQVKANPMLIKENAVELDAYCHRTANSLKRIADISRKTPDIMVNLMRTMPLDMRADVLSCLITASKLPR